MAMFEKLFVKRDLDDINVLSIKRDRSAELLPEQVRLLLFKECDWRGRKLLFDSATIDKLPSRKDDKPNVGQAKQLPCILEVSEGFTYLYKGPAVDSGVLGEMIFGAVAMNVRNVSLKIHIMENPRRLMCSNIFCVPAARPVRKVSEPGAGDARRNNDNSGVSREEGLALSFSLDRGDSGFYGGDQSPRSSVGSTYDYFSVPDLWEGCDAAEEGTTLYCPGRKLSSTSSNSSSQRRTSMNMATRFQFAGDLLTVPQSATNVASTDSQIYSNSSASGTSDSLSSASSVGSRKRKFGLALLVTVTDNAKMDVVSKCIEQSSQLQHLLRRVRSAARAASVAGLYAAVTKAHVWLSDLLYGPRLQPMWLTLVTGDVRSCNKMADKLLTDICAVLSVGDTKITNFFISNLLTHVLTYHLGWVPTVSPYDTVDIIQRYSEGTEKKPYNALWAQLTDLCGSIGYPPRAARTIISGTTNANFVNRLLRVLTYFVRCGDVKKTDFKYQDCVIKESKVIHVNQPATGLKKTQTKSNLSVETLKNEVTASQCDFDSFKTVVSTGIRKSTTLGNLGLKLSSDAGFLVEDETSLSRPKVGSMMRRNPTTLLSLNPLLDQIKLQTDEPSDQNVVFVLGDDDKLVGLKNKSNSGKSVKKSSKVKFETDEPKFNKEEVQEAPVEANAGSPSKCCGQTRQHSKPIKHSGFKFEFDKYPQIVTNYMKSKNLEILDRHYLGKPGNLKLDNFQFDPTVVPPLEEEVCETCYKCQMMEATLQTPTNASEMEFMNDIPRHEEPQFAKETIVEDRNAREISPKTFVRKHKVNTVVVNPAKVDKSVDIEPSVLEANDNLEKKLDSSIPVIEQPNVSVISEPVMSRLELRRAERNKLESKLFEVKRVIEFPLPSVSVAKRVEPKVLEMNLFGGITDHYVPDLILQGTTAPPGVFVGDLRRDLQATAHAHALAIVGDTNNWQVSVMGSSAAGGASPLVCGLLDSLQAMKRANIPTRQCFCYIESKLREFCVLSKTLADMLMTTDFCDISTLTKSLNIDINDVPLLLSVATTHTPQVATRYGISYR